MGASVLVTGFGPFEEHEQNPSGQAALGLAAHPPRGVRVVAGILPVSFRRAPEEFARILGEMQQPDLVLMLGVHSRPGWRLEARARLVLSGRGRPDSDGLDAAEIAGGADSGDPAGSTRFSSLDVGTLALGLMELAPEPAQLSWDAGGYVCERSYGQALILTSKLGVPALFVHVPQTRFTRLQDQIDRLGGLILEALAQAH